MAIWKSARSIEQLMASNQHTAAASLGIEVTGIGDDWLSARMPVDARTVQPFGILHGGASVLLAETVGSMAANMCVEADRSYCVGLDINANHLRPATSGWVTATARPFHLGRATQVWDIRIVDDAGRMVCISRLTMAVVAKPASA